MEQTVRSKSKQLKHVVISFFHDPVPTNISVVANLIFDPVTIPKIKVSPNEIRIGICKPIVLLDKSSKSGGASLMVLVVL